MTGLSRRVSALVLAGSCLAASPPPASSVRAGPEGASARKPPNIVVILIDTLRADALPFYGPDAAETPYLSRLAAGGIVFEKVWSTASYTAPATASLFTSLYPGDHGVLMGQLATKKMQDTVDPRITLNRIPEKVLTLGEVMNAAGYTTWGLSDNYNASVEMGFGQGFHRFESNPTWYWGAEEMGRRLRAWRKEIITSRPYFLYIHYIDPHLPYHKRARWYRGNQRVVSESGELLSPRELRSLQTKARYLSEIGYLDDQMRKLHWIFGWDKNTLVFVTSDHGEEFGEHGGSAHGRTLYEEVVRIPLLIRDTTGRFVARRIAAPVSIIDVLPTLAEIVGQPVDESWQGQSLLPLMESRQGEAGALRARDLFGHRERNLDALPGEGSQGGGNHLERNEATFLVRGQWKLIQGTRGGTELFDLEADPWEQENLFGGASGIGKEMIATLGEFTGRKRLFAPASFEKTLTPEELERLKTLGYVD